MNQKTKFLVTGALLVSLLFNLVLNIEIGEAAAPGTVPFGGKIEAMMVCDEGFHITVVGPRPGLFMIPHFLPRTPTITIPHPMQNVLGLASSVPIPCTVYGIPIVIGGIPLVGLTVILVGGSK